MGEDFQQQIGIIHLNREVNNKNKFQQHSVKGSTKQYQYGSTWKQGNLSIKSFQFLLVIALIISNAACSEMQILNKPTQQQIHTLNLMKSLRRYRERIINLNEDTYTCITAIKHKPTPTADKAKLSYINGNLPANFMLELTAYDKLDLLKDNIGVKHFTKEFIYRYKHKQIVSQYDDEFTKYSNQKTEMENFTMGLYDIVLLAEETARINNNNMVHTPQKKTTTTEQEIYESGSKIQNKNENIMDDTLPLLNIRKAHNTINIAKIDYQNKLIKMTRPLSPKHHLHSRSYNITLICQSNKKDNITNNTQLYSVHHATGFSLTNFEILLKTEIPDKCKVANIKLMNLYNRLNHKVNFVDDKIVGNLQKFCQETQDGVHEGDLLLFQTQREVELLTTSKSISQNHKKKDYIQTNFQLDQNSEHQNIIIKDNQIKTDQNNTQTKIREYYMIKIQKIIGENVYSFANRLPSTLQPITCRKISSKKAQYLNYSGSIPINKVQLKQNYKIPNLQKEKLIMVDYMAKNLIKNEIQTSNSRSIETGKDLHCFVGVKFGITMLDDKDQYLLNNFALTIGKKIGNDYYQIHPWENFQLNQMTQYLTKLDRKLVCFPYSSQSPIGSSNIEKNKPSQLYKLHSNKNNKFSFSESQINSDDSILVLTLSQDAVVEIKTVIEPKPKKNSNQSTKQNPNLNEKQSIPNKNQTITQKYYLANRKIYKIEILYQNGTKIKAERLENEIYENSTDNNMIIIHKSIWRSGDFVKFPRFLFHPDEKITQITAKFGTVYLRIFNLNVFPSENFAVSSSHLINHLGYGPKLRPPKSLSTQYRFKWGNFCGGDINKNREVLVKVKCGQAWFKLESVKQISPCSYELQVLTQYLCDKDVTFPALKQGFQTFNGSICVPVDKNQF